MTVYVSILLKKLW